MVNASSAREFGFFDFLLVVAQAREIEEDIGFIINCADGMVTCECLIQVYFGFS
jgi:hypothetical protein